MIKIHLPVLVCWGGGGNVGFGSFIFADGGGGGGTSCESCWVIEKSCVEGGLIIVVVSIPCVVGSFGMANWTGCDNGVCWFPIVNFGWINDDVCWVFAGFNGVNADGGAWNALGIDGGRIDDWIKGDGKWETDVGGWRSGFNVERLFGFCWNNNGEPLDRFWVKLFGAGNNGLNGVFAELRNEA